ncbi:hypothetical protein [Croceicoccus mobilis]|uniref:Uncharacterized protein n=1 Tax=Croceicoccus mobilis TaxID=1703339 RepID=A0A916YWX4_9SPHN|nr:hypothetical protein [Croceicoccus mobilis]GGD64887.1 hypothetical protein GCM10010990_12960 [Croceicoccus mobilis]
MNLLTAISGLSALPVMGMVLTASSIASTQAETARPAAAQTELVSKMDDGARCRVEAKALREYRRCRGGRWSKAQSAYN